MLIKNKNNMGGGGLETKRTMLKMVMLLIIAFMIFEYFELIGIGITTGGFVHEARGYGLQGFRGWGS